MSKLQPEYDRLKGQNDILERELSNLSERLVIISDQINNSENHIAALEETIKTYDAEEQDLANTSLETACKHAPKSPLGAY